MLRRLRSFLKMVLAYMGFNLWIISYARGHLQEYNYKYDITVTIL